MIRYLKNPNDFFSKDELKRIKKCKNDQNFKVEEGKIMKNFGNKKNDTKLKKETIILDKEKLIKDTYDKNNIKNNLNENNRVEFNCIEEEITKEKNIVFYEIPELDERK
jgi:hypothetical protein